MSFDDLQNGGYLRIHPFTHVACHYLGFLGGEFEFVVRLKMRSELSSLTSYNELRLSPKWMSSHNTPFYTCGMSFTKFVWVENLSLGSD